MKIMYCVLYVTWDCELPWTLGHKMSNMNINKTFEKFVEVPDNTNGFRFGGHNKEACSIHKEVTMKEHSINKNTNLYIYLL